MMNYHKSGPLMRGKVIKWGYLFVTMSIFLIGCAIADFEEKFVFPSPVAQQAENISSVDFLAQWNKVTGAKSYEVDVATDDKFTQFVAGYQSIQVTETSLKITNLDASTDYFYRVRAKISNQTSPSSNTIKVTTTDLNAPITYPATEVTANSFKIHWKAQPTATAYLIDIGLDANFNTFWKDFQDKEVAIADTSLSLSNLKVNQQYFYRIRHKQNNTLSGYSNIQSVFTSTLATPQQLTISDVQFTSFKLTWNKVPEAQYYQLDIATDALFQSLLPNYNALKVDNPPHTITGLQANQTYYCRLRSVNDEATSNHSKVVQTQTSNLSPPVALPASDIKIGSFKAHWQVVPNATLYLVEVANDPNFSRIVTKLDNVVNLEVLITGLEANTPYYYRVKAQGLNTISNYSNVIQTKTGVLSAPVATAPTNQDVFKFTATWQPSTDAIAYLLDVATDAGFTQFVSGYQNREVTGTSVQITEIGLRQNYYYRVRAKRLSTISAYSNVIFVKSCLHQACKVTRIERIPSGSSTPDKVQTFQYDAQNRLTSITQNPGTAGERRYQISYDANGQVDKVDEFDRNNFQLQLYTYTYTGNELSIKLFNVNSGVTSPNLEVVYTYDSNGRLATRKSYNGHTRNSVRFPFTFTHNEQGEVSIMLDQHNNVARVYVYDDKISPFALFKPELERFILNNIDDPFKTHLQKHNIVSARRWGSLKNYSFTYNSKGIAIEQSGSFTMKFTFSGCDF